MAGAVEVGVAREGFACLLVQLGTPCSGINAQKAEPKAHPQSRGGGGSKERSRRGSVLRKGQRHKQVGKSQEGTVRCRGSWEAGRGLAALKPGAGS